MRTFNKWTLASVLTVAMAAAGPAAAQSGSEQGSGQSGQSGQTGSGQTGGTGQTGTSGQVGGTQEGELGTPDPARNQERSQKDLQKFVEKAAISNMAEIQLGQLAQQKAQNPEVKQFAQMMIDEHTRAQSELQQAATSAGLSIPSSLDEKHQKLHDKLASLDGSEFDREYMKAMVKTHNDTRKLLEKRVGKAGDVASSQAGGAAAGGSMGTTGATGSGTSGSTAGTSGTGSTSDPASGMGAPAANATFASIDEWAAAKLPAVQQHLDQAKDLEKRVKDEAKNSGSGNDRIDK